MQPTLTNIPYTGSCNQSTTYLSMHTCMHIIPQWLQPMREYLLFNSLTSNDIKYMSIIYYSLLVTVKHFGSMQWASQWGMSRCRAMIKIPLLLLVLLLESGGGVLDKAVFMVVKYNNLTNNHQSISPKLPTVTWKEKYLSLTFWTTHCTIHLLLLHTFM